MPIITTLSASSSGGVLTVTLPTLDRDMFVKIYPASGTGAFLHGTIAGQGGGTGTLSTGIALAGTIAGQSKITGSFNPGGAAAPAKITVEYQSASDVDLIYVRGSTPAGSGMFRADQFPGLLTPRSPSRATMIDVPSATDQASAMAAAQLEFFRRQGPATVTIVVTSNATFQYDGWAKGQIIRITNRVYGFVAKAFVVTSVNMHVLTGTGLRQYTITAGTDPISMRRRLAAGHQLSVNGPISGTRIIGTLTPGGGMPDSG